MHGRLDHAGCTGRHGAKRGLRSALDLGMVQRTGGGDDDIGAGVVRAVVSQQLGLAEALDVGARADHAARHRVGAVAGLVEQLEGRGHGVVFVLVQLGQQHLALAFQLVGREAGVLHQIAQHRHKTRCMRGQALQVKGGVVLVGVGIDLGAQAFGLEVDATPIARARALEHHVLNDMADAAQAAGLLQAAAAHEDADAGGGQVRHGAGEHLHAIGQGALKNVWCGIGQVRCAGRCDEGSGVTMWCEDLAPGLGGDSPDDEVCVGPVGPADSVSRPAAAE